MVGYASHILSDHLGHMGSNLFWPITKSRTPGLKLTESADPYSNFAVFLVIDNNTILADECIRSRTNSVSLDLEAWSNNDKYVLCGHHNDSSGIANTDTAS